MAELATVAGSASAYGHLSGDLYVVTLHPTKTPSAWVAFSIASAFYLYEFITGIEPSLATVDIAERLSLSNANVGTLSSLFFWVFAPMQLVVGILLDRFGARRLMIPAMAVCALGVTVFAANSNPLLAAVGRLLTGLGASFAFVGALYVVNHRFSPDRFAVLAGLVNTIGMLGTAIGAVALTIAIEHQGWQRVFYATSATGMVLFLIAYCFFHDENKDGYQNAHPPRPVLLHRLIIDRRLWMIAIAGSLYYVPIGVFGGLWGQSELSIDHGLQADDAETAVSMIFWGVAAGSVGAGALSDWIGHRKWIIVSNAILAACVYAAAIYSPIDSVLLLAALLFLGGLFGGAQMLTLTMAKEAARKEVSGTIIAFVNMIGITGTIVCQPLIGEALDASGGRYDIALIAIPASLILAAVIMVFVDERRHEDHVS